MTLAQCAALLDVDPKRVLNTMTALGCPRRYSLELARRLAVTLAIHEASGVPLARGYALAVRGLRAYHTGAVTVVIPMDDSDIGLAVDIGRILSSLSVRLSVLRTTLAPRQRGRPASRRRAPLRVASDWGVDLTLLADNLRKTVTQRVRQLDAMAAFASAVKRPAAPAG